MDETHNSSGKKQRQRNQKDRRKQQEPQIEPASTSVSRPTTNNAPDPQPQRTNRRQRNEAPTTPANNIASSTPGPGNGEVKATTEKEKEKVTIDFSNLKRETEEIAKLTKKFAKRNISSNWHRYAAPEVATESAETEDGAPADFSALIQMPASKGGHLQLKDEQEWSSASNEQLGGYFTLNLKVLSQSLACIPLYEQLRLPKHMFTEEELKHLNVLASEARKSYNPEKTEDPTDLVHKTLKNLLQRETDTFDDTETDKKNSTSIKTSNDISISISKETSENMFNFDSQPEIISENSSRHLFNMPKNDPISIGKENSSSGYTENKEFVSIQPNTSNVDNRSLEVSVTDNLFSSLPQDKMLEAETDKISKTIDHIDDRRDCNKAAHEISMDTIKDISQTNKSNNNSTINNKPSDKRTKNTSEASVNNVSEKILNNVESTLKLDEDDDDLDFLLSLKKTENRKSSSLPEKDPPAQPVTRKPPQPSSMQQHSELDDWLDSVLQD